MTFYIYIERDNHMGLGVPNQVGRHLGRRDIWDGVTHFYVKQCSADNEEVFYLQFWGRIIIIDFKK